MRTPRMYGADTSDGTRCARDCEGRMDHDSRQSPPANMIKSVLIYSAFVSILGVFIYAIFR